MFMLLYKGLGVEVVDEWLKTDVVGCLQNFFVDCMKGDFLNDPEVLSPPLHVSEMCKVCTIKHKDSMSMVPVFVCMCTD